MQNGIFEDIVAERGRLVKEADFEAEKNSNEDISFPILLLFYGSFPLEMGQNQQSPLSHLNLSTTVNLII